MRKKEGDKQTAILDAAVQVFQREGFAGAQVAAVAVEAGIATGSVYLYFKGKDAILDGVFERFWCKVLERIEGLPATEPKDQLADQLGAFFDSLSEDRALAEVYLHEHHSFLARKSGVGFDAFARCVSLGEEVFSRGVKSGQFDKGISVSLGRAFVFGGVRASLEFWLSQDSLSAAQVRKRTLRMALSALTPRGLA
jgi:TetR/AcrR family fatty acid metabolism transcriptional regulator